MHTTYWKPCLEETNLATACYGLVMVVKLTELFQFWFFGFFLSLGNKQKKFEQQCWVELELAKKWEKLKINYLRIFFYDFLLRFLVQIFGYTQTILSLLWIMVLASSCFGEYWKKVEELGWCWMKCLKTQSA